MIIMCDDEQKGREAKKWVDNLLSQLIVALNYTHSLLSCSTLLNHHFLALVIAFIIIK